MLIFGGLPALTSGGRGISRVLAAALAKFATASASALATLVRLAHGVRHFFGGKATCLLRQLAVLLVLQKLSNWVSVLSF